MASWWTTIRSHTELRHIAGALSIATAIVAIVAISLPAFLYSYGRIDGTRTAIDIGIWQNKYNIGPDRFDRYLQDKRENRCDSPEYLLNDAGTKSDQKNECNVAMNRKCKSLKACSCLGCMATSLAAVLCFANYRRSAAGSTIFAGIMYVVIFALFVSIKEGEGSSTSSTCGYTNHPDFPDIQYSTAFHLIVAVSCMSLIITAVLISLEWQQPVQRLNSVNPLAVSGEIHTEQNRSVPKFLDPSPRRSNATRTAISPKDSVSSRDQYDTRRDFSESHA